MMKATSLVILVSLLLVASHAFDLAAWKSLFSFPTFPEYVTNLNYPVEVHTITTEDGYILTYFRIQAKNQQGIQNGLPVVYLQHGLLNSADTWITNDESDAPALVLANEGYDVWCGNVRGTKYSMNHVSLTPQDDAFWQFSWQNYTQYDLPAAFTYIHQQTGEMINYIGHSQGTLMMFAALSERDPTVLQYLRKYIALAPVAWVTHIGSGPVQLAAHTPLLSIIDAFDGNEFFPPNYLQSESSHIACKTFPGLCEDTLGFFFGFDKDYDNSARYDIILEYEPGGCSVMNMYHWKQMVLTGNFAKFDYGNDDENMLHYGQTTPPLYDVTNINYPVHLFFGQDDDLVDPRDTVTLLDNLTGTTVDNNTYPAAHMTFIWSKDISFYWNDLMTILEGDADTVVS